MKKIWKYLKHHLQEDFNIKEYFSIAVLLTVLIALNYTFDFEDSYLDSLSGFTKFFNYFLMYAFAFYASTALYAHYQNRIDLFSKKEFWLKSLLGLLLLSLDSSVPF